ncbi:hypothetical protein [Prevotella sp. kh1p2]|uniref:hypothetical protein n=1 Tax=Prevotella sp. kh1p2 TaxID=1761883 RepID=UPI0008B55CD1|nr:hypothetical protein [Prevotella sp. kh1p2]SET22293.1 hypothetical protein SAMN04487825_12154 [Prevotella sp. kh1p2]SNU12292.1 hypothetical protein SAMN06298210_12210 [Prevotellaceae bacterium KH2P17]
MNTDKRIYKAEDALIESLAALAHAVAEMLQQMENIAKASTDKYTRLQLRTMRAAKRKIDELIWDLEN